MGILPVVFKKLKLHRIEASAELDNLASMRVIEKLGFQKEGLRRSFLYNGKKWNDLVVYSALESDFDVKTLRPPKWK